MSILVCFLGLLALVGLLAKLVAGGPTATGTPASVGPYPDETTWSAPARSGASTHVAVLAAAIALELAAAGGGALPAPSWTPAAEVWAAPHLSAVVDTAQPLWFDAASAHGETPSAWTLPTFAADGWIA